jgi:hypothetical protein
MPEPKKPNNAKMGLILGGIALFFFLAVIAKHLWFN